MKRHLLLIMLILPGMFLAGCAGTAKKAYHLPDYPWFEKNLPGQTTAKQDSIATKPIPEEHLSFTFKNVPIHQALLAVTREFGLTLISSRSLSGTVSESLRNASLEEVLNQILAGTAYGYIINGKLVKVLKDSDPVTRVIRLHYARAADIVDDLKGLSDKAKIFVEKRTNSVIVRDAWNNVKEMEALIRQMDIPVPQVLIEAEMIEINAKDKRKLGLELSAAWRKAGQTLNITSPFQVNPLSLLMNYGNLKKGQAQAFIEALEERRSGQLLSSPRIVATNGETAHILIGEKVPYQRQSAETAAGGLITDVEFVDVGIKLKVTPTVNLADNSIVIDVTPEVSEVLDMAVQGVPRIATQEAHTRVTVQDGETVVIGGLMRDNRRKNGKSIPWLGRLFLLKYLFSDTERDNDRRELIVFITPHILNRNQILKMGKIQQKIHERLGIGKDWKLFK
ncbi:type II secretion system protein D precursor [bacterium BMS3Abin05]|nr:type II secretion system protein D precursor [bacterium BMS3Abin05]GBE28580.1 type II secretion system protein D precursor [bacterium BMS3Bbin03]